MFSKRTMGRRFGPALALAALTLTLAGCRDELGERPLGFEPGQYQGEKDEALSDSKVKALQDRAKLQD